MFGKIVFNIFVIILLSDSLFCQNIYDVYISQSSIRNHREEKVLVEFGFRLNLIEQYNYKKFDFAFQNISEIAYVYQKVNKNKETVLPNQFELKGDLMTKYKLGFYVDPFVAVAYDTQTIPSFINIGTDIKMTGMFRDPVTTNQSLGFAYMTKKNLDVLIARIGLSARQIRAKEFTQLTDDRKTIGIIENYKEDYGIQIKFDLNYNIDSNSNIRSNFEMYSTIQDEVEHTFKFNNEFRINIISNIFAVVVRVDLLFDERLSKRLQYNQVFRLGLNYKFNLI